MTYTCTGCGATRTEEIAKLESTDSPRIVVSNCDAMAGQTIQVTVSLENNPGVASLLLEITFDSSVLTLTEIVYNGELGGQTVYPQVLQSPVHLYWIDAFGNLSNDAVIATLTFTVNENATVDSSVISISYRPDDVYNLQEENVDFTVENGTVTIISYLPGDIDGNGVVNSKDGMRLLQYLAGWNVDIY